MKKVFVLTLFLSLIFFCIGCSKNNDDNGLSDINNGNETFVKIPHEWVNGVWRSCGGFGNVENFEITFFTLDRENEVNSTVRYQEKGNQTLSKELHTLVLPVASEEYWVHESEGFGALYKHEGVKSMIEIWIKHAESNGRKLDLKLITGGKYQEETNTYLKGNKSYYISVERID